MDLDPEATVLVLDMEGYETKAIEGARRTINENVRLIMVEGHMLGASSTVEEIQDELGKFPDFKISVVESGSYWTPDRPEMWVISEREK